MTKKEIADQAGRKIRGYEKELKDFLETECPVLTKWQKFVIIGKCNLIKHEYCREAIRQLQKGWTK